MLIIVDHWLMFSDKELHAFILEGWKGNELGTCDSEDDKERRPLHERLCSLKNGFKRKEFYDIDPRKNNKSLV
jgi:hypothetical protein